MKKRSSKLETISAPIRSFGVPPGFAVPLLLLGLLGTFLRLYLIRDQILLDDEWHSFFYASEHPLKYLWRHPSFDATCAPINAYLRILLFTVGWSELWARLPALLPGLLSVFIFPVIVRKAHGTATALLMAALLAMAPFLIFYSRFCRPYAMLSFLGFISLYAGGFWLLSGKRIYQIIYAVSSVIAIYFHPLAIVTACAPLAVGAAGRLFGRKRSGWAALPDIKPNLFLIGLTGGLVAASLFFTVQSSIIGDAVTKNPLPGMETWKQTGMMFFGTTSLPLAGLLLCFCLTGAVILPRKSLFWGAVLLLLCLLHLLMIAVTRFDCIDAPIVLSRYLITLFPVCYIWTATGLLSICTLAANLFRSRKKPAAGYLFASASLAILGALAFTSPLRVTYAAPNNFTNHSAFQEKATFDGWDKPYRSLANPDEVAVDPPVISPFYQQLPADTKCLIEYPLLVEVHWNFYYLYQHLHKKRIVAGYASDAWEEPKRHYHFYLSYLTRLEVGLPAGAKIHFRNLIDILDQDQVRKSGADYLILHPHLLAEFFPGKYPERICRSPGIDYCTERLKKTYGPPVFQDETVIVFDVSGAKKGSFE